MWAKGPMPGYSPKKIFLKFYPDAVCQRVTGWGLTGYVVYLSRDAEKGISGAATAKEAWDLALGRQKIGYDVIQKQWTMRGTDRTYKEESEEE